MLSAKQSYGDPMSPWPTVAFHAKRDGPSEADFYVFAEFGENGLQGRLEAETFPQGQDGRFFEASRPISSKKLGQKTRACPENLEPNSAARETFTAPLCWRQFVRNIQKLLWAMLSVARPSPRNFQAARERPISL